MARKKQLEQRVPDAAELFCALDAIVNPDIDSPDYSEAIIAYPDFDPREYHSESDIWMFFGRLTARQQARVKRKIRLFSRLTGKEFMTVAPKYCAEKGCTGHFNDAEARLNGFPSDLNNCYLYITKISRH